jgi:hypothetical protein
MSSIKYSKESKLVVVLNESIYLCARFEVNRAGPILIGLFIKLVLVVPDESFSPGFTTTPITDIIFISTVDQYGVTCIQKFLEIVTVTVLFITHQS